MATIVFGLARRARLPALTRRHGQTTVMGLFALVNGIISIGILAGCAYLTGEPFIFPSLGPTAFLFFYTPCTNRVTAQHHRRPRHRRSRRLPGPDGVRADEPPALATEVTGGRVGVAALSLGLTSGAMVWARVPHPPAGATTLIVSLGILRESEQLAVLMLAVALLAVQAFVINRLAGIDYPRWRPTATGT